MSISIVIPTLNEVDYLKSTITHFLEAACSPDQLEVIVIDAGSDDHTLESIGNVKCRTYVKPEFRHKKYASLNFGLSKSKDDIVLFLDADTLLPKDFDRLILEGLQNPNVVGGAFEFDFTTQNFLLRIIKIINRIRYRIDKLYFGDQAVFCLRDSATRVGGVPSKSLMESAYFCQSLKKVGELRLIKSSIKSSSRRFTENGILKVLWFDFQMWIRFQLGLNVSRFGLKYWKQEH